MANENKSASDESRSSATPFLIIGLIFLVTIVGIWWISQSGNAPQNNQNTAAQPTPNAYANAPAGATPETFKGSPTAGVVIEEFADFQCGACASKHSVFNEITSFYGSRIKFVFRNYPLIRQHPKAYDAAVAVESAGIQGKFWEMQNLLFANQTTWSREPNHRKLFRDYAKTINIDVEKFENDSLGIIAKNRVDADMKRGNAISVLSTPSVYVNGKSIGFEQMTVPYLKEVIDAELKKVEDNKKPAPSAGSADDDSNKADEQPKPEGESSNAEKDDSANK